MARSLVRQGNRQRRRYLSQGTHARLRALGPSRSCLPAKPMDATPEVTISWRISEHFQDGTPKYTASHEGKDIACVYETRSIHFGKQWLWALWWGAGPPVTGHEDSRREAFLEVERRYNRDMERRK